MDKSRTYISPEWMKIPERGTVLGIRLVFMLAFFFGRRLSGIFVSILGVYYALFNVKARRASQVYLARVGEPRHFRAVLKHFSYFAQVTLDRFFFLAKKLDSFEIAYVGHEHIHKLVSEKKGALLLCAHIGSFEALRAASLHRDVVIHVVVDFRNAKQINRVLSSLFPDLKVHLVELGEGNLEAMMTIKKCVEKGELVAVMADRLGDKTTRKIRTSFLGHDVDLPSGPYLLAHLLQCQVYFVSSLYEPPNRYTLYCEPFDLHLKLERKKREEKLLVYVKHYANFLEKYAKKNPYNWFNFFPFWVEK